MPSKKTETANQTHVTDSMLDDADVNTALTHITQLVIEGWGTFVGKHSERLRLTHKAAPNEEIPLEHLQQILVTGGGVSLSSDALEECAKRGIPVHFIDYAGRAYASLFSGQLTGTVKTRRAQLLAYTDERGLHLGKSFAAGKIHNQLNLLRYMSKNRSEKMPELFAEVRQTVSNLQGLADELEALPGPNIDAIRGQLLNLEGRAAHLYWQQMKKLLLVAVNWPGREGQGATDLVNSLLNYGYGVLYTRVEQALMLAGLDPFAGFVHTDRPGKPSLVYDLVEEFRQPIVDRTVFALLNLKTGLEQDEAGRLTAETRKLLIRKLNERLQEGFERYERKNYNLQYILYNQARHIASFVRGDLAQPYTPFECSW
jgi:CRISPR-associated protein Cas1